MPVLPNNDLDYIDEESEDITSEDMTDGSSVTENNATYNDPFDYNGPADIGVPDPLPVVPVVPEEEEEYYYVTYYNRGDLTEYEPAYLQELAEAGCKFYAIYDDETEVEVQWTEIEDLDPLETEIDISASIADAANQHFWNDANGVHVAEVAKEDWQTALEEEFEDLSSSKNYYNILMNSLGLLLRRANFILTSINRASISFYDGLGNETTNIMASFGRNSAQIGRSNDKHVVIDNSGLTAYNSDGTLAPLTGTFDGANINNSSITNAKIVDGTIEGTKIASATIDNSNIKNSTIEGTKIASATIDNSNIKNGTITGAKIADGTIENTDIKNGTITGAKIASATIENSNIKDGTIQGSKIVGSTLTGIPYAGISDADIEVARVANAEIAKVEVNYAHITNGVIDNAKISHADVNGLSANYATVANLNAATARIGVLEAADVTIDGRLDAAEADIDALEAEDARIGNLVAQKASITDLNAATARIGDLEADHVSVEDFEAEQANIDTLQANTADIATIRANSAKVQNLTAAQLEADHATVGSLSTTYATITNLNAATGRISDLESTRVRTTDLEANYITADTIEANYTKTDLSNTDVAWIQNGTIKDGAISNAMIGSLSASKLTAGTINGNTITVTNLNADNITAGTLNGQRIGEGSLSLSKLEEDVYTESEVDSIVSNLQTQIDGAIETWTGTAVPTLNNSPANGWTTNAVKDTHVGDVYFVVNSNSQQNGYNYRFTKSGSTYSWQLIKDSDVTNALQRLSTAEGKIGTIEQFDSDISSWKTDTDEELASIKSAATTLAGRVTTAEGQIATKVETSTFNTLSQTVDENSASISQLTTETTTLTSKVETQNPFIIGTQTAQTGNWTGEAPTLSSLVDGQQITYWLPFAGSGNASLNLTLKDGTTTGAIPCYYGGTTRLTTHYAANNAIHLTYRTNVSGIAQGWWADANYDTNTPYSRYSDTVVSGKNGLKRYTLCMRDDAGNFTSIVNQANNISVSGKTCYTGGLQLGSVCYHATGGDYAAGANSGAVWESYGGVDFRYSTNGVTNAAATTELQLRKPIYLVGTIGADGLFYLDTTKWWTQTSFVEDKAYVFVGTAYSSYYAIYIAVDNPTYIYEDGELIEITTLQISKTTNKINTVSDTVDEHTRKIGLLETSVESKADGSTVETMSTKLNTVSDTVDGHTQSISSINSTLSTKADSSTVSTLSTKVNTIEDTVDGHTQSLQSVTSTQTSIQQNAVKSTVQLWFTKADTTAPNKPTAHVTTNNAATGNAWNLAVPTYNASYPNYYYCYEYEFLNGTYGWSAVTRDIATGEMQERARTAITNAAAADTKASNAATAAANAQADIDGLEVGGRNYILDSSGVLISGLGSVAGSRAEYRYLNVGQSYVDIEHGTQVTISFDLYMTVNTANPTLLVYNTNAKGPKAFSNSASGTGSVTGVSLRFTADVNDVIDKRVSVTGYINDRTSPSVTDNYLEFYSNYGTSNWFSISNLKLEKGNCATDWTPAPEDVDADISTAQTSADNAQATADKNVKESVQLWFTKANGSAPSKPNSAVTSTSTSGNAWTTKVPTYSASYPHYFYCMQYKLADGTHTWSDVVYDQATTEAQSVARTTSTNLSTLQQDYATFKQTTQNFESTIGTTYATKTEVSAVDDKIDNLKIGGRNLLPSSIISSKNIEGSTKEFQLSPAQLRSNFGSGVGKYIWNSFEENTQYTFTVTAFQNDPSAGTVGSNGPIFYFRYSDNTNTSMAFSHNGTGDPVQKSMTSTAGKTVVLLDASYGNSPCVWTYRNLKLEKGNRATDWTPAPEDVDADILSIETRLSSAETSITQNNQQIALKANASDVYTKTQTDGLISTEVSNRNSAIEQSASAINLSVSETYTTKTEFNNRDFDFDNLMPNARTMALGTSSYSVGRWRVAGNADMSKSRVEIEDGPFGSCGAFQLVGTQTVTSNASGFGMDSFPVVSGERYRMSLYARVLEGSGYAGISQVLTGSSQNRKYVDSNTTYSWASYQCIPLTASWKQVWVEFEALSSASNLYIGGVGTDAKIQICMVSLKVSQTSHTELESAKSEIKTTTDSITSTVEKISSAKYLETTYQYSLNGIRTYAAENYSGTWAVSDTKDSKVGDTVYLKVKDSTRNCYVYIKATVTAVSGNNVTCVSHGYEDVIPVDTIKSTINQSSDSVKIQANHVEIDGTAIFSNSDFKAAADAAYDAKGSAAAVQTNLDNLEIGGRNLASSTYNTYAANGYLVYDNIPVSETLAEIGEGSTLTLQLWGVELDSGSTGIRVYWGGGSLTLFGFMIPDENGYVCKTITVSHENVTHAHAVRKYFNLYNFANGHSGASLKIDHWKIEKGNKATDWTPAPEDVDATKNWYATCDSAAGDPKVATITPATSNFVLIEGATVNVKFTNTNSLAVASLTLNVNGTGAKNIKYMYNNTIANLPGVGYLIAGGTYQFVYDGTYWQVQNMNYNTNTNTYDRLLHNTYILAVEAVTSGALACATSAGYKQIKASQTFDMSYPILWAGGAWTAGTQYANSYEAYPSANPATTGTVQGLAKNTTVYLKGTISGNTFTCASSNFLTCTVPVSADAFFYIPLGVVANDATTKMYFSTSRDLYAYLDGKFRQVTPTEIVGEQYIYCSAVSGTNSMAKYETWVEPPTSVTASTQNSWTVKRPEYSSSYPVLFVAKQTKRLDGTVTCTTPVKDDTTTIIDGGHITTGTIDADRISTTVVNAINANVSDTINADKINVSAISIGSLNGASDYATKSDAQGYANAKDNAIAAAAKRTDVSIAVTAINYDLGTATLQATLYVDGTATTSNVTYKWMKDGSIISGQTARTLSVTAAMGLSHVYSCTVTYS